MKAKKSLVKKLIHERDWKQISKLVREGKIDPNWNETDEFGRHTLLFSVICGEAEELAVQLIQAGAETDYFLGVESPLILACGLKLHKVIEALVEAGADVNLKARVGDDAWSRGHTALMMAAEKADLWAVRRLLRAGADANAATKTGETALFWAGYGGGADKSDDVEAAREILKAGAKWRGNELHIPVFKRDVAMVKFFLESGCDVNGKLRSPLLRMNQELRKGDTSLIVALRETIRERFRIEAWFCTKETSLAGIKKRRHEIIKLLAKYGANISLRNRAGENAHDIACKGRDKVAIAWLNKYWDVEKLYK